MKESYQTVAGIDEAGRGPLIGPIVFGGVALPEAELPALAELGLRDSKVLSPKRREALAGVLRDFLPAHGGRGEVLAFSPREIDEAVFDRRRKLSGLTEEAVAALLDRLRPGLAYVDLPGPDAEKFSRRIQRLLDYMPLPRIRAEHKADATFPIVSAASILAKVARDAAVREIEARYSDLGPLGSGYPADPVTQAFLARARAAKHACLSSGIFRTSWKTFQA